MSKMSDRQSKLNKKDFSLIFELCIKQPWLSSRSEELCELVEECENSEEQILVCDLIRKFKYLTVNDFDQSLNNIINTIINLWQLPENNTRIVASAFDNKPDSSHHLIYCLKTLFPKYGWNKPYLQASVPRSLSGDIKEDVNIILIDEFIGTGKTMLGRASYIRNELTNNRKIKNSSVFVCVIASMEEGKKILEENGVTVFSSHVLKRGISDYYTNTELTQAISGMKNLESSLKEEIEGEKLPSFGYGKTEALYSREYGNTPNSVFPIFWWPLTSKNQQRNTILHRGV